MPNTGCIQEDLLVREAQGGNRAAFDQLIQAHDQAVLRLVLRITRSQNEAQDISQEAFLRIYKKLGGFRFDSSFSTWIHRIVTNVCLEYLRRKDHRREGSAVALNAKGDELDPLDRVSDDRPANNPEQELLRGELRTNILCALQKLTPRERTVFELRHLDGLRVRTIGQILNTSQTSVKNTSFRATHKLRIHLAAYARETKSSIRPASNRGCCLAGVSDVNTVHLTKESIGRRRLSRGSRQLAPVRLV